MKQYEGQGLTLRPANENDLEVILGFIYELARFEGAEEEIQSTEAGLRDVLFGRGGADAMIAELEREPVGFAIWAYSFSTFTGKRTLYIDDIYVREHHRGKGIGSRMFRALAEVAYQKDCGRMDWYCMETNLTGKEYYRSMGAEEINWFKVFRLNRQQIEEMKQS